MGRRARHMRARVIVYRQPYIAVSSCFLLDNVPRDMTKLAQLYSCQYPALDGRFTTGFCNSVHFVWGWVMISRRFLSLVLSLCVLFSTGMFVQGQSTYGSITGSVTDPSGAAIADAQVTLTNLGTAEK